MKKIRNVNLTAFLDANRGSQKKIAEALKIKSPTISAWKSGRRPVPPEYLTVICGILGVTEDDLCQPLSPLAQDWAASEEVKLILKLLPQLSDYGLKKVLMTALRQQQSETKPESFS